MKPKNIDGDAMTEMVALMKRGWCPICRRSSDACDLWARLRVASFASQEAKAVLIGKYHGSPCIGEGCADWDQGGGHGMCVKCEKKRAAGRIDRHGRMVTRART